MSTVALQDLSQDISLGDDALRDHSVSVAYNVDTVNVIQGHLFNNITQSVLVSDEQGSCDLRGRREVNDGLLLYRINNRQRI